eukprot:252750_1
MQLQITFRRIRSIGMRRDSLIKKFWFVMYQTSPKCVRLQRSLLGKVLVPSKNGIHKPLRKYGGAAVGVLSGIIRSLNTMAKSVGFGIDDDSQFVVGTVAIQFDATSLNGIVKYIESLDRAVGFSDWWNDEYYDTS